jgi:hypothetical protein
MSDPADDDPDRTDERETADAGWLLGGGENPPPASAEPPPVDAGPPGGYDVLGSEVIEDDAPAPVVPPIPERAPRPRRAESEAPRAESTADAAVVDPVWTRWGEWGPDVLRLAAAGVALLFLLYLALSGLHFSLAFLMLVVGGGAMLALGYPMLITLERPVRIVPEQAVTDYYGALSHLVPHYRRMWLLLSSAGRHAPRFSSFASFRAYWGERLSALAGPGSGRLNPLSFAVTDFQSERSSGQTSLEARFTLNVFRRSAPNAPIASYPMKVGLVKGPDRMWYLNSGTLPEVR